MLGGDALRMELHAVHGKRAMGKPHDHAVMGLRRHRQIVRQARAFDHERMVARGLEWGIDAAKHAFTLVLDLGQLAVDLNWGAHDLAAESLPDRLMAETDTQQRYR